MLAAQRIPPRLDLGGAADQRAVAAAARVVAHQHVEVAERVAGVLHESLGGVTVGHRQDLGPVHRGQAAETDGLAVGAHSRGQLVAGLETLGLG